MSISIVRNLAAPQFTQSTYTATIEETVTVGSSVAQVGTTDTDSQVFLKHFGGS